MAAIPTGIPVAQPLLSGPNHQDMTEVDGILMQQKFDLQEIFCPACQKRNRYKIKNDSGWNPTADEIKSWEDSPYSQQPVQWFAKEESDLCCRICLQKHREFEMFIRAGEAEEGPHVYKFHRPFRWACCMGKFCPNEINAYDANENHIGSVTEECRASTCCGSLWWNVKDASGSTQYYINDALCGSNCCAPSCCCAVHNISIMDAQENPTPEGYIRNIFPGCNCKGLAGQGMRDSYHLKFPKTADDKQRALLLAGLFLIEYMIFEKEDNNN